MRSCSLAVFVLVIGLVNSLPAADYVLSFEERDRFEGLKGARPGPQVLQIWVDGKKVYQKDIVTTGPLWHEVVSFDVADPERVRLAFRLAYRGTSAADPQIEIGNVRVAAADGGTMALQGEWTAVHTDEFFVLQRWRFRPLPSFRDGFSLRRAAGEPAHEGDYAEWRFEGRLAPVANLQIRRLFEYPGCYAKLNFYDDWKNVRFTPAHPRPGEKVTITATVHNAGSLNANKTKVSLLVDGKPAGFESVDIPPNSKITVSFTWTATDGFHSFLVRAETAEGIPESRSDDNWLLRTLVVGEPRRAHPYLLFQSADVPKLRERLQNPPAWYASYYNETKTWAGAVQPDEKRRFEEPSAIAAAHNAFLALVEPEFRPLTPEKKPVKQSTRQRATDFLKTIWEFPRGHFSDAPCAIVHYAQAYDWIAPLLSAKGDKAIRARLKQAVQELVRLTWTDMDPRLIKGPPSPKEDSFYPRRRRSYSQGTYIDACAIVVGALALAGEPEADEWLHFGLNAIDEEVLREMTTPHGYYREGHGYMGMAESRSGAACWLTLQHIGAPPFELYPLVGSMHELFLRDRMPNGWSPPINDSRATYAARQILYASLYPDPATRAAARWDWKTQTHTVRGQSPDGHFGNLFLLTDTTEVEKKPAVPPPWTPTQLLGDYLVFRSDWTPGAAYLCLNTKHFPTTSVSHDQNDKNSFLMYAKKAFLAIDPGYGNTAGPALIKTVLDWCRGGRNPYNHNMVVVDGRRPMAIHRSPYVYPASPFPENTFITDFLDFGESVLRDWWLRQGRTYSKIDHRRSVLFVHPRRHPKRHYFIIVDSLTNSDSVKHKYEFVINGNCRHPYYGPDRMGDFVLNPRRIEDVPRADNLTVTPIPHGLKARWLIENADGKDVAFRLLLLARGGSPVTASIGDGWLAYVRPVARNKYLAAQVDSNEGVRFLAVLYADRLDDPSDDVKVEASADAVRLTFADGTVHIVAQGPHSTVQQRAGLTSDAEIVFCELSPSGRTTLCFLARGRELHAGGTAVAFSRKVDTAAIRFRDPGEAAGYLSAPATVNLQLVGTERYRSAWFRGEPVILQTSEKGTLLSALQGRGQLRLTRKSAERARGIP